METPCDKAVILSAGAAVTCPPKARIWILAATILGSSLAFVDSTVVNVALPALQASFHSSLAGVQWVVESYGIFLAALILVGGSLGDLWGRRFVFVSGVVIFALASMGCGLAASVPQLIIARSIQGVGAALLVPGSLAIISTSFDESSRGKAIGTWSGFTAITSAIGPVLGGWLVEHASWRWVFFINLPLAVAVIFISLWQVPESRRATAGRVDWAGAILATLGLGGLVYGFIESVNRGWKDPLVFGSVIVGFACLVAFLFIESHIASPMLPLELFKSRAFAGANLLTLLLYVAVGMFFFLFPLDLIQVQGYSATAAGAAMLPFILLMFSLSRWSGGLVSRYGGRGPLIIGPLIVASGFVLLAVPAIGGSFWWEFFPAVIVLGFGMAITVAPLTTVVMNSVDQDRVGAASGINNAVARVAGVMAIAVLGIVMVQVFSSRLNHGLARLALPTSVEHELQANVTKLAGLQAPAGLDPSKNHAIQQLIGTAFTSGFRMVMLIGAGLALASAAATWLMIPKQGSSRPGGA
ncbi:MAG TPA: MFS transporter [Candidatus Sulfotelmatobacter sp.]|jgi:EmrB/QacA subfamily drug resistance transporter